MRTKQSKQCTERFIKAMDEIIFREREKGNKMTLKDFTNSLGLKFSNMGSLRKKSDRDVTLDMLISIVKLYKVSPVYLLEGKGEMFKEDINIHDLVETFTLEVLKRHRVNRLSKVG